MCGILSKVRHFLDRKSLMRIYNSLFDSRLSYGLLVWGTAAEHDLMKLRVLQNRAVRFITFSPFRTKMAPLFSKLKILPLKDQIFLQRAKFMHGLHYKNLPFALSIYCHQPEHSYLTRYKTSHNYVLPSALTNRSQGSIKFTGPKVWAKVPDNLKEVAFRKPFSRKLKEYILKINYKEMPNDACASIRNGYNEHLNEPSLTEIFESDDEVD